MPDRQSLVRLIATLLFGLSALALLGLLSAQMAGHYFQGAAESSLRRAFTEGAQSSRGTRYQALCRGPEVGREGLEACDPREVAGGRSLRSTECSGRGLLQLLGRQWRCAAKFSDGASLEVHVSIGLGDPRLELLLPLREPDS